MAETAPAPPILDAEAWLDAPQAAIEAILAQTGPVLAIDATAAGPIAAQAAQLLIAARRTATVRGQAFRLIDPSAEVIASLAALGLGALAEGGVA